MAGNPSNRKRFTTDKVLLQQAKSVALNPPKDASVFYADTEGAQRAAAHVKQNSRAVRLDELLMATPQGAALYKRLTEDGRHPWSDFEEVWWELSWRLARESSGVVHCFGPDRMVSDQSVSEFKHKFTTGAYAHTVFEKVELPELESNPRVTQIFINGRELK